MKRFFFLSCRYIVIILAIMLSIFLIQDISFSAEAICRRGDILVCEDWEDRELGQTVGWNVSASDYTKFGGGIVSTPQLLISNSLRTLELMLKTGNRDTIYPDKSFMPQQDATYVRWYARWSDGFVWNSCSNKHLYLKAVDSGNIIWRVPLLMKRKAGQVSVADPTMEVYCSHTDYLDSDCTGGEKFFHQNVGTPVDIIPGQWYEFEMMVKPDTTGVPFSGELKLWINGKLKSSYTDVSLRKSTTTTPITHVWITSYYGCTAELSPQDQYIWYDNLAVSTNLIGPIGWPPPNVPLNPTALRLSEGG